MKETMQNSCSFLWNEMRGTVPVAWHKKKTDKVAKITGWLENYY